MKLNKEDLLYNKKMIGRKVLVLDPLKEWKGVVLNVVDEETFEVENVKTKKLEIKEPLNGLVNNRQRKNLQKKK